MNTLTTVRLSQFRAARETMIPTADPTTGFLPLGRYASTLAEVEAEFVTAPQWSGSVARPEIWSEFVSATTHLRSIVPVCNVWISGSFLTQKAEPDDIDVMYWVEDRHVAAIDPSRVVDLLVLQKFATNQLRNDLNLRIDSRVGQWHARPEPAFMNTPEDRNHMITRGFWDDFWQRARSGAKGDPPVRTDALPKRGYIEVVLDGHDVN